MVAYLPLLLLSISFLAVSHALSPLVRTQALLSTATTETPPINISQWTGRTVMMISAHPDDIEAMAGGLIRELTAPSLGVNVVYVIVTNGDKGCTSSKYYNCSALSSPDIAQVRLGMIWPLSPYQFPLFPSFR